MKFSLRPYQKKAIQRTFYSWRDGVRRGVVAVPTGGGKSLIQAEMVKTLLGSLQGYRVLALTHVKELIEQNSEELLDLWPEAPVGIYSAGIGRRELDKQITFAGIQSFHRVKHKLKPAPNLVIVDECHLINNKQGTMYKDTLDYLFKCNPKMRLVGLSATPFRLSSGWLHTGKDAMFEEITFDVKITHLIENGWLCRPTSKATETKIDTSQVKHGIDGDFQIGDLQRCMMEGDNTPHAVDEIIKAGANRKKWIVFSSGVKHANQIRDIMRAKGVTAMVITGTTPKEERKRIIADYKRGAFKCIINFGVLTTGFNVPEIDLLAMLRSTESAALYIQIIGRGMRTAPGKKDCLVLDFAGNVMRHGPVDAVLVRDKKEMKEGGEAPCKCCPDCQSILHTSVRECPDCGHLFPPPELKIAKKASNAPLLKEDIKPERYEVQNVSLSVHSKSGKADSVRIDYQIGIGTEFSQWIFPESRTQGGQFYYKKFCHSAGLEYPFPETAEEFVDSIGITAEAIEVDKTGKYPEIKNHHKLKAELLPDLEEVPF